MLGRLSQVTTQECVDGSLGDGAQHAVHDWLHAHWDPTLPPNSYTHGASPTPTWFCRVPGKMPPAEYGVLRGDTRVLTRGEHCCSLTAHAICAPVAADTRSALAIPFAGHARFAARHRVRMATGRLQQHGWRVPC